MSDSREKNDRLSDAPLTDEEFDTWWPFSDDDLDQYEREIEESLRDYEWVPPPHLDEKRRQARMRVRRSLAEKYPDGIPGSKTADAKLPSQPEPATTADDDA